MRVRLIRKLAEMLDGVDLSPHRQGDVFKVSRREAQLLMAEGWAVPVARGAPPPAPPTASSTDSLARLHQLAEVRYHDAEPRAYRRIEDWIREEIQDARAQIVMRSPPDADEVPS